MIPIQPWMIKAGAIGAVVLAIFFAGWHVKGKMVASKVSSLEDTIRSLEGDNKRLKDGVVSLEQAIENQNRAIEEMFSRNAKDIERIRAESLLAIQREREYARERLSEISAQNRELLQKMENMTWAEACHTAWLEVVSALP